MEDLELQLEINIEQIKNRYASFVLCVQRSIKEKGVNTAELCNYLMNLSAFRNDKKPILLSELEQDLERAKDIDEIFKILCKKYASFLNFGIFQSIVKAYGIDRARDNMNYAEHLQDYITKHKVSEFVKINPLLETFANEAEKITIKLDIDVTCSLARIVDLKKSVAKILGLRKSALRILDVKEGCVKVTLIIPTPVADVIFNSDRNFTTEEITQFQGLSIIWLECNGQIFYFREIIREDQTKSVSTSSTESGNSLCM